MLFSRDVISDLLYLPLPPDVQVFVVEQQDVKISDLGGGGGGVRRP